MNFYVLSRIQFITNQHLILKLFSYYLNIISKLFPLAAAKVQPFFYSPNFFESFFIFFKKNFSKKILLSSPFKGYPVALLLSECKDTSFLFILPNFFESFFYLEEILFCLYFIFYYILEYYSFFLYF